MLADLDALVSGRFHSALALHGDLGLDEHAFGQHIGRVVERHFGSTQVENPALLDFVRNLHTDDLFLSLACARGSNHAWQRFSDLYRKYVADLSRHLSGQGSDVQELGEALWVDLFLPDRTGASRIASYDGRSSLATWLRVVVSNRIINERLRKSSCHSNLDAIPEPEDQFALKELQDHPALNRYKPMILSCFSLASKCLTKRERLLILLRYEENLQLGEIARLFVVHQSTITRQMDRAARRLRDEVIRLLASQYHLNDEAIGECLSLAAQTLSTTVCVLDLLKIPGHNPLDELSYSLMSSEKF
jgi:RNA polymerase sigma-70 factor